MSGVGFLAEEEHLTLKGCFGVGQTPDCDLLPPSWCLFSLWPPCPGVFLAHPCSWDLCGQVAPNALGALVLQHLARVRASA